VQQKVSLSLDNDEEPIENNSQSCRPNMIVNNLMNALLHGPCNGQGSMLLRYFASERVAG
jgi:hypothetical protein